ncbi:MAG: conjugal transfer protein TraF [Halomonadaceae bacterium]|nr:conjugal transfer protein TraF [Halomonadaceae bacterium]
MNKPALRIKSLSLAMASCMGIGLAMSHPTLASGGYYERAQEGWWWYQELPIIEEEEPEKKDEPKEEPTVTVMQAPPAEDSPEPVETTSQGPAPLSAEWFRDNLQTYMDKAIDDPSKENVEAYFLLQRVMMDKAQNFADMSQRVVMGDPVLDEINRRSLDPSSSRMQETLSAQNREKALDRVLEKAGLAFFFSSDCALCTNQARILSGLSERTNLEVIPVTIDGLPLPDNSFSEAMVADQGQAEALGITEGPALVLMAPPDRWVPISYGVISQEDIISRVLMTAADEGIITESELNKTRPIHITSSLSDLLTEDGSLPDDTQELIHYLRSLENK